MRIDLRLLGLSEATLWHKRPTGTPAGKPQSNEAVCVRKALGLPVLDGDRPRHEVRATAFSNLHLSATA
jgi:hypothetical protein